MIYKGGKMCINCSLFQLGIPLNDETLDQMSDEERQFWGDFLYQANCEFYDAKAREDMRPFKPSADLTEKYRFAVGELSGKNYCQILQLEMIFDFGN